MDRTSEETYQYKGKRTVKEVRKHMKKAALVLALVLVIGLVASVGSVAAAKSPDLGGECPNQMAHSPGGMSKCPHHQMKPNNAGNSGSP